MSLTGKRWLCSSPDHKLSNEISRASRISPILAQVLINRGLTTINEIDSFISPKLSYLANPYEIPDIEKGAKRVLLAKERGESVAVWGDYDVDGVTATSIILLTLKDLGINSSFYIPHRYDEGYGLNKEGIKKLADEGVKLIITVDCGISNVREVEYAATLGIDVVVTDHHNPPNELPNAVALINPKFLHIDHVSRDLSGAGVAFKFAWALYRSAGVQDSANLMSLLDLAGIGTIADIVPLLDENRILAIYGLKSLNNCKRVGLRSLMESAGVKKRVTTSTINYAIAPRLNSAGRLEHASSSVELLLATDELKAKAMAVQLSRLNTKRQSIGSQIQEEAFAMVDKNAKAVILSGEGWNPGVIGIVASQIVDKFYKPTVLIGVSNGIGRGSARSIEGVNIYDVLNECRDLFMDFGGHRKAAGFKVAEANIPELIERIKKNIDELIVEEDLSPVLDIEHIIPPGEVNMGLASELELLQPNGEENQAPNFASLNVKLIDMRRVGDGSHLKAKFTDGSVVVDSIGFSFGHLYDKLRLGANYDVAYNLEVNEYNGFESAQLNLLDIRPASATALAGREVS